MPPLTSYGVAFDFYLFADYDYDGLLYNSAPIPRGRCVHASGQYSPIGFDLDVVPFSLHKHKLKRQ